MMFVQKPGSTLQPSANQSSASSPAPHASTAPKKQKPTMPPTTLAGKCSARSHFERPRITWPARSSRPIVHDEVTTIFSTFDRTVLRARATSVPFVALEARAAASCPASCAASVASSTRAITAITKISPQQTQDFVRRRNLPLRALRAIAACTGSRQLRGAGSVAPPRGSAGLADMWSSVCPAPCPLAR